MKDSRGERTILWISFGIFALYAASLIFPFIWMLLNSFKTNPEFFANVWSFPEKWLFSNYSQAFQQKVKGFNLAGMFANSMFIVLVATVLSLSMSSMPAYVIAKYRFPLRKAIYMISIIVILVPSVGSLAATFRLLKSLGLYNRYIGIFLMYSGGFGFSFILLYGYFQNISWSYAEAAFIDGAGDFKTFALIMIPQAAPAIGALAVIQSIGFWNDYFTPYMFLPRYPTIAVGLNELVGKMTYASNWPVLFAVMILSIIPIIVVFIAFQKTIMENTVAGGLKG